jgi:hypothetical protein
MKTLKKSRALLIMCGWISPIDTRQRLGGKTSAWGAGELIHFELIEYRAFGRW